MINLAIFIYTIYNPFMTYLFIMQHYIHVETMTSGHGELEFMPEPMVEEATYKQ